MMNIDIQSVALADWGTERVKNHIDYAGFPPYLRGNSPLFVFPEIVLKQNFSSVLKGNIVFNRCEVAQNQSLFFEQTLTLLHQLQSDAKKGIAPIVGVSSENFTLDFVAYVRALRTFWSVSLTENHTQLGFAIEVNTENVQDLLFVIASSPEYIFCDQPTKGYILKNQKYVTPHTIDAFGGNVFLEEKTMYFLQKLLQYTTNDDKVRSSK